MLPLAAQTPPPAPAPVATPAAATPAPAAAPAAPAAEAASPVPSAETWLTGYIDLGYQWQPGVGGSYDTYRSIVNFGSGPKLIGADFTILDPKRRLFDRIRVRAYDWGDNPYESLHLFADKQGIYEFNAEYRRMAYFNDLPSYANPLIGTGVTLDEQAFDTRRTIGSFTLDLFKGRMIAPFLGYDRDLQLRHRCHGVRNQRRYVCGSGYASGFHQPVSGRCPYHEEPIPHHTGRRRHDLQERSELILPATAAGNPGNGSVPIFGQTLDLSGFLQDYGIRGTSVYSKGNSDGEPVFLARCIRYVPLQRTPQRR